MPQAELSGFTTADILVSLPEGVGVDDWVGMNSIAQCSCGHRWILVDLRRANAAEQSASPGIRCPACGNVLDIPPQIPAQTGDEQWLA